MASEYINKLETVSKERQAFKTNVRKYKLAVVYLLHDFNLLYLLRDFNLLNLLAG